MPSKPFRITYALTSLAVLFFAGAASLHAALPKTFDLAPENTQAVIVVKNLDQLQGNIDQLQQNIGLTDEKAYRNPIAQLKQKNHWDQGMDAQGSMVVAFVDLPQAIKKEKQPTALIFLPVSDYDTFLANYNAQDSGGVTQFTDTTGQTMYAKSIPGYAVTSKNQTAIDNYKPANAAETMGQSIGQLGEQYVADGDIAAWVDLKTLAPSLLSKLRQWVNTANQGIDQAQQAGFMDKSGAQHAKLIYKLYAEIAGSLVRDSDAMVIAGNVDPNKGLKIAKAFSLQEDSMTAQFFPGGADGVQPLLGSLPSSDYILAMAMDFKAINVDEMVDNFQQVLANYSDKTQSSSENNDIQADTSQPMDPNSPLAMYTQGLPMLKEINGISQALYVPDDMAVMSGAFIRSGVVYETDDPQAFIDSYRQYLEDMNGMSYNMGPTAAASMSGNGQNQEQPAAMLVTTSFDPNQMQIEGIDVSSWSMAINMPPQMAQQMGPMAMFMSAFTRYQGYIAAKGKQVMVTTSPDPALARQVIQQMGKTDGLGAKGQTAKVLDDTDVPGIFFQGVLSAQGIAQTGNAFLQMFQMQPIKTTEDVSPVAYTAGVEDNVLAGEMLVPLDTMKFIYSATEQVQGMMGPGPQSSPNGNGPQPAPF